MKKIIYSDIKNDKDNLLMIINKMCSIYKKNLQHTKVLECQQLITMLNRIPIQIEYTADAILTLKNILNDCANIYLVDSDFEVFETGELAMNMMNKISLIYKENKNGNI
jgi:hypothetical protein